MNIVVDREEQKLRYAICVSCEMFEPTVKICKKCGCFMVVKTRLKDATCRLNYWNNEILREKRRNELDQNSGN